MPDNTQQPISTSTSPALSSMLCAPLPAGTPAANPATGSVQVTGNQIQHWQSEVPAWIKVYGPIILGAVALIFGGGTLSICKSMDGGKTYVPATQTDEVKALQEF